MRKIVIYIETDKSDENLEELEEQIAELVFEKYGGNAVIFSEEENQEE